jgi:hypothetical protein
LYGCGTWYLNVKEENSMRVTENMVLKAIFIFKRQEITGDWKRTL